MRENDIVFIQPKRNRPSSVKARQCIRATFSRSKKGDNGFLLTMYIGKDLAKKLNFKSGDKIAVGYSKANNRTIVLKRADTGYTLSAINGKDSPAFRVMLQWQVFEPRDDEMTLREVGYTIGDSGEVILNLETKKEV